MYRQTVRFYVFLLTLLEISLNSKLTAQGKNHGVTHEAVWSEGITFHEWGKESAGGVGGAGGGGGGALSVSPARLSFGSAPLGAAHALTVTVTNTANTTVHLASVAGTTPDFHASFFDSKTLAPQANTTFSVVYVGRREGPVVASLYIHTSLGVHKYEVSAVGTVSAWGVWPLVGLRVPRDAPVAPTLVITNPTDTTVQVVSVYSSAGWLGLELPEGGAWAPRALWALPPRARRALVRLRVDPSPPAASPAQPRTAYIRIKTDAEGYPPLVVCVEARSVPPGVHADPVQLRAGVRGSGDPPHTFEISLGNSAATDVPLEPTVSGARCSRLDAPPTAPPAPPAAAANGNGDVSNGGGGGDAARVALLTTHLEANSPLRRAATVTLDWSAMWAAAAGAGGGAGALCSGYVQLGDAALPYSATLLPGTVRADPLRFVTAEGAACMAERALEVHNTFTTPVHFTHVRYEPRLEDLFHVEGWRPGGRVLRGGERATLLTLRLRALDPDLVLDARVHLHTNLTEYTVPVLVYSGKLSFEWSWPESYTGALSLGAVPSGGAVRVRGRLLNPAPAPLCLVELAAHLPHASLAPLHPPAPPAPPGEQVCVPAGGSVEVLLQLRAPTREGPLRGAVSASTPHARIQHTVTLHAVHGHVRARTVVLDRCAPWVQCAGPLLVDSTMGATMRLLRASVPPEHAPALHHVGGDNWNVGQGESALGEVRYRHELHSRQHYTGLDMDTTEGAQWRGRAGGALGAALAGDAALLRARIALLDRQPLAVDLALTLDTTHVVQVPVQVSARLRWPHLARVLEGGGGGGVLAAVRGAATLTVAVHNPSSRPLLVQPLLGEHHPLPDLAFVESDGGGGVESDAAVTSLGAFNVSSWRAAAGEVAPCPLGDVTALVLQPGATVHLAVTFTPHQPALHRAYLYLRNNLTVVEAVTLRARGAQPSFELAGRPPHSRTPILFEVSECGEGAEGAEGVSTVRRVLALRNTGAVPVTVTSLLVSGAACAAHGFSVQPCAPLLLAPNETRRIEVAFTADWTLARVSRSLALLTELGRAEFPLVGAVPARLLPLCAARPPRAPGEWALRGAGAVLAILLAALTLSLAALDSEAILKRALAAMHRDQHRAEQRAPLDLRALNHPPAAPPAPPPAAPPPAAPPRRRRTKHRHLLHMFDDKKEWGGEWKLRAHRDAAADLAGGDSSEETEVPPPERASTRSPAPPEELAPLPPGEEEEGEAEDEEEDAASTGTESTSSEEPASPPPPPLAPDPAAAAAGRTTPRAPRDPATPPPRRHEERARPEPTRPRTGNTAKYHSKKDKSVKRKVERPPAPPPPASAPASATPPSSTVRRGATFSEVVARGDSLYCTAPAALSPGDAARPLAPIGSDLRKRSSPDAPRPAPRPADHSLFYFNGDCSEPRPWDPAPPPPDRYAQRDCVSSYAEEGAPRAEYGGLGSSLWSGGDSWTAGWGGYGLRPPPGFPRAPPRPAPQPPVRAFDPFHALAAIWASDRPAWAEPAAPPPPPPEDQQR